MLFDPLLVLAILEIHFAVDSCRAYLGARNGVRVLEADFCPAATSYIHEARFAANRRDRELRSPTRSTAAASELAYLIGGVSEKMLSQTLRRLEMNGFVHREVHATKPPKVEYGLSPLGCELGEHVHPLLTFVHKNANRVLKSRESTGARGS